MKFHDLQVTKKKSVKRVGRGIAAGQGKTAGRGTKGQKSRTGGNVRPGFEGGQMPLYMRLPKSRGFASIRPEVEEIYTGQLEAFKGKTADNFSLFDAGLISSPYAIVKVLNRGELTGKVTVKLQKASAGAVEVIQKAGGSFEAMDRVARTKKTKE